MTPAAEPHTHPPHLIGMPGFLRTSGAVLIGGAILLITGCSGGPGTGASSSMAPGTAGVPAGVPHAPAVHGGLPSGAAKLTGLAPLASQSIIYTANLTLRARDVTAAAAQAARIAQAAGGYVASESSMTGRAHHKNAAVLIQLKIPAGAYPGSLTALSKLGTALSRTERAQDVTQRVADVASRVASARDAITQLRALLARAGTVTSLLSVQDQINSEEASLEALQAQQRALAHETTYATITLHLVSTPPAAVKHHHRPGGFTGGLAAGWRGLRAMVSGLLTGAGAVLPFAIPAVLLALLGYWAMRWRIRHRAEASQAD